MNIGLGGRIIGIRKKFKDFEFFSRRLKILILELLKMYFKNFRVIIKRNDMENIIFKKIEVNGGRK